MKQQTVRRIAGVAFAASIATLGVAACSNDDSGSSTMSDATSAIASAGNEASGAMSSAVAGSGESGESGAAGAPVELDAADGSKVTLNGPIAAKFNEATEKQKTDLGKPLTGPEASGTTEGSGAVFQQFDGGVITAKSADAPAYITWGKIRDAWNVKRDDAGQPAADGKGGSAGPLGVPTSDETDENGMKVSTFENGKITYDQPADKVEVTVKDQVVPTN